MTTPGSYVGRAERLLQNPRSRMVEILALVSDRLAEAEAMFRRELASPLAIVDEIGEFVATAGGKRVRPTLHLLCSRLCGYRGPHDVLLATVLEFIHSATLIHDDIVDDAQTRRGRPSVNSMWGNNVTVLFGDYLLARAMERALQAGSLRIMQELADITLRMAEGEMLQTRYAGRLDLTVEEHLDLVERKTARLFGGCCELAGILAGVSEEKNGALRRYGLNLGLAFQIVDDLLDFTGDEEILGKPAGSDLREGKVTLAVIDLLSMGSAEARELTRAIMESNGGEESEIGEMTGLLRDSGALARAQERAQMFAERAVSELAAFREGPERQALATVPELLIFRDR